MTNTVPDSEHSLTSSAVPDFFVWIEIEGEPVEVYSKLQSERNTRLCYIEAIEGKAFAVKTADLRTSDPEASFCTHMYLDGVRCDGILFNIAKLDYTGDTEASWRYYTTEERFRFNKLQTTDDDAAACTDKEVLKQLGSIQPIHEKHKKVAKLSHQATVEGPNTTLADAPSMTFDWFNDEEYEHPFQIFEFRYRSRDLLQLDGHLPESPLSSPLSSPSSLTLDDDEAERQEKIARLEEEINALKRRSQGGTEAGPSGFKKVKLEVASNTNDQQVKKEKGSKDKGKGKEKEVLVLSDSD
ncbi:hypothetical protein JCM16303_000608 [Sporobolomyces ruberrimus]